MYKQLLAKISFALMIVMLLLAVSPVLLVHAATRTAIQSGDWNDENIWEDSFVPGPTDDVTINSGVTVTVTSGYTAACKNINFTQGTAGASSISLADSTSSLSVSGAVTIQEQASGGSGNQINVGAGAFSAASVTLQATTDASRYSQILISTGTVTVSGNITSSGTASRITFSGAGRLYAGGTFLSGAAGTFTPFTSTVDFNANGAQTVGAYPFNNLILSGSDLKSMPAGASIRGNLNISGSAKASVTAGQNLSVGTLTLGGLGTDNGSWGSTSSTATHQTNTYFDTTTGYLTVTIDTRTPWDKLEVTGPDSLTYGTSGTIIYTGGSVNEAISYSQGSSTGCEVNVSTGEATVTNVSGTCIVSAVRAENGNHLATKSDGFGVTLNPLAVTLSGSRVYDSTAEGAAKILSITNKIGTDDVTIVYGSATLASAIVGTQPITSMGNLVLGGLKAANYTLAGAIGSVTIKIADQAPLTVIGPASVIYGSTGTITYRGSSGIGALSYSHGSSTGCRVNGSSGVITVTNVLGSCTVTASKAADRNYLATTSAGFSVTINPRPVTLTGKRDYDSTDWAEASILTISNKVGGDNVTLASGSATLASANVGTRSITSMNSLALGGAAAANYTLTGASGSVTIGKPYQTITFTQPTSPATYKTSFTVAPTVGSGLPVSVAVSGVCSISGNTVTMTSGTGPCTLTASQAGNANYRTANDMQRTVMAQRANQTITFSAPASPATYNTSFLIDPTSSSGQPVNVSASGGCSISGNTVTMISGTDTCTLTASQAGDANYNPVVPDVKQTVTAQRANQTITFAVPVNSVTYNSTFVVSPTSSSGLAVTVSVSGACAISGSTVTMTSGEGKCNLTASQAGDANYNPVTSGERTVIAQKANQTITFNQPATPATYYSTFTAYPTSSSGLRVKVAASGGCTIMSGIVIMTSGEGICTITASQAGDTNYNTATNVVRTVTAQKANQKITFLAPTRPATYGSTFPVSPTADSGLTVTVTASGACSISGSNVTMISGTNPCTLTASQAGNSNYKPATNVQKTVMAQKADQTITFNQPASQVIYLTKFTVYPTSSSGLAVTVATSGACSISGGTVTINSGTGTCTLTASQAGDTNYNAATNLIRTVTASKASQTITFNQPASLATYGSTFTVSPTSSSGLTVKVTPSGVCTISGNTVTMTSGTGTCTLTASEVGNGNYNAAGNVNQTVTAQKVDQTITFNPPASPATYNSKFTVSPTPDSGLTVKVTPSGVCTISGSTVTMTSGEGICTLTASQDGNNNYNRAREVVQTVTAHKAYQIITFPAPANPAKYNSTFTVAPKASSTLTVTVSASGACTISGATVTMTSGVGTCSLTASQAGNEKFNPSTNVVRTVTAQKLVQAPLIVTGPASVTYGTYGTITFTGGSSSGSVLFSYGSSTGCIVDASTGMITVTDASGSCTIWVTKESDNNYLATSSAGFEVSMKRLPVP